MEWVDNFLKWPLISDPLSSESPPTIQFIYASQAKQMMSGRTGSYMYMVSGSYKREGMYIISLRLDGSYKLPSHLKKV